VSTNGLFLASSELLLGERECMEFQVIAREVVNSKKAITRLTTQKAHMLDMEMAMKHQLGATTSTAFKSRSCGLCHVAWHRLLCSAESH
jgi:hypothetical protein